MTRNFDSLINFLTWKNVKNNENFSIIILKLFMIYFIYS